MARSCSSVVAILIALAVLLRPAAVAGDTILLSPTFHAGSCPQLEGIVRSAVRAAVQKETAVAAGLLRLFFHDCYPQSCDGSILLKGAGSELNMVPNLTLQPRAIQLIEDIRAKVHAACGRTVSCTDITALATREAVVASGGASFNVLLGKFDSFTPASGKDVGDLPKPFTSSAATLVSGFTSRGLADPADLVALSGGHTIGRSHCSSFDDRLNLPDPFSRKLKANCSSDRNRLQNLDVVTPDKFDNGYFKALASDQCKGVLTPDMALIKDTNTSAIVKKFAQSELAFFAQFAKSMVKLSKVPRHGGNVGEIRHNCFSRNAQHDAGDEGLAASA